jgi:hypothetical protein
MINLVADFETTSWEQYKRDGVVRVWAYSIANIDTLTIVNRGTTIEEFFDYLSITHRDRAMKVYFHNLKFDGSFILNYLLNSGYSQTKNRKLEPNQFQTLITDKNVWYNIRYNVYKAGYKISIEFRDSWKKLPYKVSEIAKAYKLPIDKGEIDFNLYRPIGYKPTDEEWSYVDRDVLIVAHALKTKLARGLIRLTSSSDAFNYFKNQFRKDQFIYLFPKITEEEYNDLKKAYKGGWTYVREDRQGITFYDVISLDRNSMHPASMRDELMPYGRPCFGQGKYKKDSMYPIYVQNIDVSFDLKENYVPIIQTASLATFNTGQFITSTDEQIITLTLTHLDLALLLKHHHINYIKYNWYYSFKASRKIYTKYIDEWYEEKQSNVGALREDAKGMLNYLYGKFGTNPIRKDKSVYLEDNTLKFINNEEKKSSNTFYLPTAIFTTAYSRDSEINLAQRLYEYFIYGDTDSLKLKDITLEELSKVLPLDDNKIGAWKVDGIYKQIKVIRPKAYAVINDKSRTKIYCAGLPEDVKKHMKFDHLEIGFETDKKLMQLQVQGGCVLKPIEFTIKERKKKAVIKTAKKFDFQRVIQ